MPISEKAPLKSLNELSAGDSLGRYELIAPIAEGGMAAVWAARLPGTRGFSKTFAIKTILPALSDDPRFERMFLDEARIASRIRHPNVVEILDLGEQDALLYLVMEWIDGEPLGNLRRDAVRHGGMPLAVAVRIAADACAGIHAAHELKDREGQPLGLVHRDISPQNILVTFGGIVKIVDFGVAKAAGRTSERTRAGQVKGKPPYMSPEQALGEEVDRRTDIFALGIILYQLTTGKHPFRGESDLVTLHNIVSDKKIVPPRAYDRDLPKSLNEAILKALAKDPDRRHASMAEFEAALDAVAVDLPRARQQDVADFVQQMAGPRGQARRSSIVHASQLAEERSAEGALALAQARNTQGLTPTIGNSEGTGGSHSGLHGGERLPALDVDTPATVDPHGRTTVAATPHTLTPANFPALKQIRRPRRSATVWAATLVLLGATGAGAWYLRSGSEADTRTTTVPNRVPVPAVTQAKTADPSQPKVSIAAVHGPGRKPKGEVPATKKVEANTGPPKKKVRESVSSPADKNLTGDSTSLKTRAPVSKSDVKKSSRRKVAKQPSRSGFVPPPVNNPGF